MHQPPKNVLKKFRGTTRYQYGLYRQQRVGYGNPGNETPSNTEGSMRQTHMPSTKDDLYLARLNRGWDEY